LSIAHLGRYCPYLAMKAPTPLMIAIGRDTIWTSDDEP